MNKFLINLKKNKLINISQLSNELKIQNHTLRFWEDKFKQIKPTVLSGRRYYSRKDVKIIELIKFLLKEQGLTIEGAKKILKNDINSLDDYKGSSITSDYFKTRFKTKSKALLEKIRNLKR